MMHGMGQRPMGGNMQMMNRGSPGDDENSEGGDAAEVQAMVTALKADASGALITDAQLLAEFKLLDINLNGWLDKDEFLEVYKKFDPLYDECEVTIKKMLNDYNMLGDNKVSYDEFCLIMLKLAQK
uniref:EF-hand domain-containing protein n=1 Tax=Eutreptiella gymnastica TaxID=73025 RepID=A0A7S1HU20_9EUGL